MCILIGRLGGLGKRVVARLGCRRSLEGLLGCNAHGRGGLWCVCMCLSLNRSTSRATSPGKLTQTPEVHALTKIQNIHRSPTFTSLTYILLLLLLLLCVGAHLLAESKVRHFQTGKRSDADKQNQEQRDDCGKSHEQAWCEVLVPLKQAALVAG